MTRSTHAVAQITPAIVSLRGHRVILDRDLAAIYGVPTKRLDEQVKRNAARVPAVEMSIYVVRAFVQLRSVLASNEVLAERLNELETRIEQKLESHDAAIAAMLRAIRELMAPTPSRHRGIGVAAEMGDLK